MQDFCPCDLCSPNDPAGDGLEISVIRREQENSFMDWYDSLPERWEKAWAIAIEFVKKWNPDVR